ncbi:DEAD/DEAH box helicase family protein [Pelosinus propionicus]|uniref:Superfamily II DNA and RNA helicase n=1 Tax=Pelosinus propionicus DSM 13327 TaxID=1123291 RepID=A0A1I4PXT5_9FIRM|nr:DEAD/DEAH box helicase family protein [Pelosinus propionicus]SFM32564.1 Superfamily II DNA and RNA helicase [Pelosinus propionicus DSM 13327]
MIKQNNFQILTDEAASRYKFNFCKLCRFYECELVEEYMLFKKNNPDMEFPSYDKNELVNGCPMKKFVQIECGRKRVADSIGDAFKINTGYNSEIESNTDKWEPNQPVFISAQTGQGKNYFVENTLLPYIRELNHKKRTDQKVLIISNRIALRLQTESRINNINGQDSEENVMYCYGEFADVISYQSILNRVDDLKKKQERQTSKYIFVICDEAHFFTSDAMFNPDTDKILSKIVNIFRDAIRIYMSATPYECIDYIKDCEDRYSVQPQLGVFYHFKRDYSYLDVRYYSSNKELTDIIINSGDERWLIFIDNKDECKRFKGRLESVNKGSNEESKASSPCLKGKVLTVKAESKNNSEYQKMILNESFDSETKVLIATSVIDNGINFRGINNIVVSDISKVKCLQMVGRGRVDNSNDKITLYIKRFDEDQIESRLSYLMKQQDAYYSYDLAYDGAPEDKKYKHEAEFLNKYYNNKSEDWKTAKRLFARDRNIPTRLFPNRIARSLVGKYESRYKAILEEMKRTDEGLKVSGQSYLEYQLSWFGKKYNEENDITIAGKSKEEKKLIEFLEAYVSNEGPLFKDAQDKFSKEFTELHDKAFPRQDPNKERVYGVSKINTIFKKHKMNYEVESKREKLEDKKTYWKVVRANREADE